MRLYTGQHRFYAGIDLHARSLYAHVLDERGRSVLDRELPASPDALLHAIEPLRDGLVVGVECMFAWYWLSDLCAEHGIDFVLGHALAMKAIHGGKTKTDKIDAAGKVVVSCQLSVVSGQSSVVSGKKSHRFSLPIATDR